MSSLYTFAEYSPDWPRRFEEESERLHALLGDELVAVHHIGSTSVPGLAAKPIIDMMPLVREITRMDELVPTFEAAGYKAWGEYGIPGRRYFTKDQGEYRTHNIHIFAADNPEVERHLAFAAYLREYETVRREYETLKRQVYALHPANVTDYNNGKDAWIKQIEPVAVAWYREINSRATSQREQTQNT
jgi:GrpB-like predicted nucleotidyltransferase (UPF0157 family)